MDIIYNEENALKRKNEYDEKLKLKYEKKIKEREKAKKFLPILLPIIMVSAVITGTCDFFALINEKTLPTVILFIITFRKFRLSFLKISFSSLVSIFYSGNQVIV